MSGFAVAVTASSTAVCPSVCTALSAILSSDHISPFPHFLSLSTSDGLLNASLSQHYSPALVEVLQSLLHPDPAQRPAAAALATHLLQSKYPYPADRRSAIFPPSSSRDSKLAQLQAENAQLRAKLGLLV